MKSIYLTILTLSLLSISFQSNAQVRFGAKGGLNLATVLLKEVASSVEEIQTEGLASFYAGGLVELTFSNSKFKLQAELLYNRIVFQRSRLIQDIPSINETTTYTQLAVPIIGKYEVFKNFNLYAGAYFGFKLDAQSELPAGYSFPSNDYNVLDIGLVGGAEYNIFKHFFVEARYNFGLTNAVAISLVEEQYNRFFQLGVGYRF